MTITDERTLIEGVSITTTDPEWMEDTSTRPYILVTATNQADLAEKLSAAFVRGYTPKLMSSSMVDTAARRVDVLCEHVLVGIERQPVDPDEPF